MAFVGGCRLRAGKRINAPARRRAIRQDEKSQGSGAATNGPPGAAHSAAWWQDSPRVYPARHMALQTA